MKNILKQNDEKRKGSVLVLVVVVLMILTAIGMGLLTVSYGVRHQAIMMKNEETAMLAAEAGYEKAVFWMNQQQDMLTTLYHGSSGLAGTISFTDSDCNYSISLYSFVGARPIYRIESTGHCGMFDRTVSVLQMQAIGGWDMGLCRIPSSATATQSINFVNGETIDMPVHINNYNDSPDNIDIYITGNPLFLAPVAMGESRYTTGGTDKYASVISLFNTYGIYFNQPDSKVTDANAVESKVDRFRTSTKSTYQFEPNIAPITEANLLPAVQLEFFVDPSGTGKVRITQKCVVRGFKQTADSHTYDYRLTPDGNGSPYERYYIYAYHFRPIDGNQRFTANIADTYVTQSFGGVTSDPGGQIYVNGNAIIGGDSNDPCMILAGIKNNTVNGKITVVATGNIWVANSIVVDGTHDANGKPTLDNPNVLGLFAQKVVKVVDPGISEKQTGSTNNYPGEPNRTSRIPTGYVYNPIGIPDTTQPSGPNNPPFKRHLPNPMVVEAAMTDGSGGWGAENVKCGSYGGRKNTDPNSSHNDVLTVRGSFTDVMRGIVGSGTNGYLKDYHLDQRLLQGILPGDIGLQGKYVAAPAGWSDYMN